MLFRSLFMMVILLILGLFLDWVGVALLTMPIFVPIIITLGYDQRSTISVGTPTRAPPMLACNRSRSP